MQVESTAREDNKEKIQKKEVQQPADGSWQIKPHTPAPVRRCPYYLYRIDEIRPWVPEDDEDDLPVSPKPQTVNTLAELLALALSALHSRE